MKRLRNAEGALRPGASVFVIAVGELRGVEILPDLKPADDSVGALDRLVYLVNVGLAFRQLPGRRRSRVRMQFERQMTDRRGVGIVNLNFIEIDRTRRTRGTEHCCNAYKERANVADVAGHARL